MQIVLNHSTLPSLPLVLFKLPIEISLQFVVPPKKRTEFMPKLAPNVTLVMTTTHAPD